MIRNSEVTGDELNAEKKEMNTTRANARSVPVFRLKLVELFFSIGFYYSILIFGVNPHKVILARAFSIIFSTDYAFRYISISS